MSKIGIFASRKSIRSFFALSTGLFGGLARCRIEYQRFMGDITNISIS